VSSPLDTPKVQASSLAFVYSGWEVGCTPLGKPMPNHREPNQLKRQERIYPLHPNLLFLEQLR